MAMKRFIEPATWPVTLAEAKAHLRVDFDDDNDLIEAYIEAAVDFVDGYGGYLGRALIDQTWDYYLDAFPGTDPIEIPLPPLIEVIGVFYQSGGEQEFSSSSYTVDPTGEPGRISLLSGGSWPTAETVSNAVRIRFRAGYLDQGVSPPVESVPGTIKAAILLHIGDLYANRETVVVGQTITKIPRSVDALLSRHKYYLGMA